MSEHLTVTIEGHVATIVYARGAAKFVSADTVGEIADAVEALDADDTVRAVVFATEGKVFCGGADLTGDKPLADENGESETPRLYRNAVRLFSTRKPIVMAVQGSAIGAGLGLTLVGDFRVAAPEARFSASFVTLGFHAGFGITHTLPRVVGEQHASLMLLTGRRVKAEDALRYGLADEVVPLADVRAAAQRLAAEIAANAPLAVEATRATMRGDLAEGVRARTEHERAEQDRLMQTADFREGIRAVGERRAGNFVRG